VFSEVENDGHIALGCPPYCTLANRELRALPQAIHRFTMMDEQVEAPAILVLNENLTHFQAQVIHQLHHPLFEDFVHFCAGGKGAGKLVEQRKVFVLPGQRTVAHGVITEQARVDDGDPGVGGQQFHQALVFF